MAGPPSKKRRSENESPAPSVTTRASTRRAATKGTTSSSPRRVAGRKTVVVVPKRKEPSPRKTRKLTGKYKSLHSFFGVHQSPPSYTPSASPIEDVDDLIEDVSDEEKVTRPGKKEDGTLLPHVVVSKPGVMRGVRSLLSKEMLRSSHVATPSPGAKMQPEDIDTRPWPEKYAPESVEDLALNRTKVKEVWTCLRNILCGSAKQRLVVLKGPAGTGKTATVEAVAKDMNVEILEWRNPQTTARGEDYGDEGAFSAGLSGMFEEFIGRAGKFGSLELVSSETGELQTPSTSPATNTEDTKRKFIVIEDFPNTLFTSSSAPLQSFRRTIKSFLALPPPPLGAAPLPPLILIITETASVSGPGAFTAHRLLSPEILHHHLTHEINFNKIAPTFMFKALTHIVSREAQQSNRKLGPSKPLLDAISSSGDIRSAIMSLQFLSSSGQGFTEPIIKRKRGKKPADRQLTEAEARMVTAVTQRGSNFGIFHAVGKVMFNKRYGDDVDDAYMPPPPRPPIPGRPYHNRGVRVDVNTLIDETGTDPLTFLAAIHENFLPSCNPGGRVLPLSTADEEIIDTINACLDDLSDADLLLPRGYSTESMAVRAGEIAFQVGVRGVMLSLPSPVKRLGGPQQARMYYPTGERLWREQQEVGDSVEWLIDKERAKGMKVGGKKEAIEERVPFMAVVERRKNWRGGRPRLGSFGGRSFGGWGLRQETMDEPTRKALEKATAFKGVGKQSEEVDDDEGEKEHPRSKWKQGNNAYKDELSEGWFVARTEKLELSDDDIEEF